jgi:hypothetical protein
MLHGILNTLHRKLCNFQIVVANCTLTFRFQAVVTYISLKYTLKSGTATHLNRPVIRSSLVITAIQNLSVNGNIVSMNILPAQMLLICTGCSSRHAAAASFVRNILYCDSWWSFVDGWSAVFAVISYRATVKYLARWRDVTAATSTSLHCIDWRTSSGAIFMRAVGSKLSAYQAGVM